RLSFRRLVTGFRIAGRVTRNNWPLGSPSPPTTLQPANRQVKFRAGKPSESRTIRRVCASAEGAQNAVTTSNRRHATTPARRLPRYDLSSLIVFPIWTSSTTTSLECNVDTCHLQRYSLGSNVC